MEPIEVVREFVEERKEAVKNLEKTLKIIAERARKILGKDTKSIFVWELCQRQLSSFFERCRYFNSFR